MFLEKKKGLSWKSKKKALKTGIVELVNTSGLGPETSSRAGSSPAIRNCQRFTKKVSASAEILITHRCALQVSIIGVYYWRTPQMCTTGVHYKCAPQVCTT